MSEQQDVPAEPWHIDPADDPTPGVPDHLAPDDAGPRPWVDPSKDPTLGVPGHAAPEPETEG